MNYEHLLTLPGQDWLPIADAWQAAGFAVDDRNGWSWVRRVLASGSYYDVLAVQLNTVFPNNNGATAKSVFKLYLRQGTFVAGGKPKQHHPSFSCYNTLRLNTGFRELPLLQESKRRYRLNSIPDVPDADEMTVNLGSWGRPLQYYELPLEVRHWYTQAWSQFMALLAPTDRHEDLYGGMDDSYELAYAV